MAVSKIQPLGGANDFTLDIGSSGNTTFELSKEYSPGAYSVASQLSDATIDIYAINIDGSIAGYTNTKAFTATKGFSKLVVIGATTNDLLAFSYKTTYSPMSKGSDLQVGPFIDSVSPSMLETLDDTATIMGGNFLSNVEVTFTGSDEIALPAKSITRVSSTELLVTRPDGLAPQNNPYTVTVTNPGLQSPIGSSRHILSNSVSAGTGPSWQTAATLPSFRKNTAYSTTVVATDTENTQMTYSIVSGNLPTGISLNPSSGVVSGTTGLDIVHVLTIRATDTGGNYLDRQFTLPNASPIWSTAAGALTPAVNGNPYSYQLSASDDSAPNIVFSISSGSLPSGLSLSSSGLISGTPTAGGTATFSVNATDNNNISTERGFSIYVASSYVSTFTSSSSFTFPAQALPDATILVVAGGGSGGDGNAAGGAGGAGELIYGTATLVPGSTYGITVGAGGSGIGNNGGNSAIGTLAVAIGGGHGGLYPSNATSGGSGGGGGGPNTPNNGAPAGAAGTVPSGCTSYRNAGGNWQSGGYNWGVGGGGGGAGSAGVTGYAPNGGAGLYYNITGTNSYYAAGGSGLNQNSTGVNPAAKPANTGHGGDGTSDGDNAPGGSGIVVIKYFA
jgi:hypothetical protein